MMQGQIDYLVTVGQISWVSSFVTNSTLLSEKQKIAAFFESLFSNGWILRLTHANDQRKRKDGNKASMD